MRVRVTGSKNTWFSLIVSKGSFELSRELRKYIWLTLNSKKKHLKLFLIFRTVQTSCAKLCLLPFSCTKPCSHSGASQNQAASHLASWRASRLAGWTPSWTPWHGGKTCQKIFFLVRKTFFVDLEPFFGRVWPQLGQNRNLREKLL